jgi:hypothetical protein
VTTSLLLLSTGSLAAALLNYFLAFTVIFSLPGWLGEVLELGETPDGFLLTGRQAT